MPLLLNAHAETASPYSDIERAVINREAAEEARRLIGRCPAHAPTPLHSLPAAAAAGGVGQLHIKDEGPRFGLNAFKALGGGYAVARVIARTLSAETGNKVSIDDLANGAHRDLTGNITVACASSGNHGRAVAAGARHFGCRAVIYVPGDTLEARAEAIEGEGATVVRHAGTYDEAVAEVEATAREKGWVVISDTSWPGYEEIPVTVMTGYTVMAAEALEQLADVGAPPPSHAFIQGGVGGVAAATLGTMAETFGPDGPKMIVVEPVEAACLLASAVAGQPSPATGSLETIVGPLNCKEVSAVAWPILKRRTTAFATVTDRQILDAIKALRSATGGDPEIGAGPAGAAGYAAFTMIAGDDEMRAAIGLDRNASVLLFVTEGSVAGVEMD